MVARQLHHHPAWSVAGRAAELDLLGQALEIFQRIGAAAAGLVAELAST